ncbi:MAG TPA: UrcA family protein [Rhizomicrobium sp.]|nr:UrcA family protein [Rhizomicrobium sp.]
MRNRAHAMVIGGALGLLLVASSAGAQEYGPYGRGYYSAPPEEVIVRPPPYARQRSEIGAPIVDVSMSRPVRIDDLDLRTRWGVRSLRNRVSFAARSLCNQLDAMYPASYDEAGADWPTDTQCYRDAYSRAMDQADGAIRAARGEYSGY